MFTGLLKRTFQGTVVALVAAQALVVGQGNEISKILADARKALGADKVSVTSLSVTGRNQRTRPDGTSAEQEFEMYLELPDKFMKREVVMAMGPTSIYRLSGFNGAALINEVDTPPSLSTGGMMVRMMPSGGTPMGASATPEQIAENNKRILTTNRQDFARLALGMFVSSSDTFPLQFAYGGEAEAADGKAYVVDVTGDGGFKAKLFVDTRTNLPLMLSWMDKEPLSLSMNAGPGGGGGRGGPTGFAGGGGNIVINGGGHQISGSPGDLEKMQKEMDDRMKEAEARRRIVEYRLFYGEYKAFSGVKLPTKIQRMIDGAATDEMSFDKVQVNGKIDPKKFTPTKTDSK